MNKDEILSQKHIEYKWSRYHQNLDVNMIFYAIDEYYVGLRDCGFITEKEYSDFRTINDRIYYTKRK